MKSAEFPKTRRAYERRLALLPKDIEKNIAPHLSFERGIGANYHIADHVWEQIGSKITDTPYQEELIFQLKFCEEDAINLKSGQVVIGWIHPEKEDALIKIISEKGVTAIAMELMKDKGRKVFWENSWITGQLAAQAALFYLPVYHSKSKIALIGYGDVGKGAYDYLRKLGVTPNIFTKTGRDNTFCIDTLVEQLDRYHAIISCPATYDTIICETELKNLRPGAVVVDAGMAGIGNFESQPAISPFFYLNRGKNVGFRLNHLPTIRYKSASEAISRALYPYIKMLMKDEINKTLEDAIVVDKGKPITERIGLPY